MHHPMRLGSDYRYLVERRVIGPQAVGLHQDVGDPRRLKQHAPFRDDNQKCMHVVKIQIEQNKSSPPQKPQAGF